MNRYMLRLLLVAGLLTGVGLSQPLISSAQGGWVRTHQSSMQLAINFALYCPDATQTTVQGFLNLAVVDTGNQGADSVTFTQSNVQTAYNIAYYSPGATQTIAQAAGNVTSITVPNPATVTGVQSSLQKQYNFSFFSDASVQTIVQAAVNAAIVQTGSATVGNAVQAVIAQSNVQYGLNVCIGGNGYGKPELAGYFDGGWASDYIMGGKLHRQ